MRKRILSGSLTLLFLVILALGTVLPAYAVTAAEFEAVYQWNQAIFSTRSTDEEALKSFTEPQSTIPSDNEDIIELAVTITKNRSSEYSKAKAIHDWVSTNMWYDMDLAEKVAGGDGYSMYDYIGRKAAILDNLETKRGVCGHYAYLTVTLLRAAGIPAVLANGYADSGYDVSMKKYYDFIASNDMYSIHGWCEAFVDGRWIIIDTTWDSGNTYQNGKYSPQRTNYNDYFDVSIRTFSKDHVYVMAYDEFVRNVTVPDGADSVFPSAFASCKELINVTLPDSIVNIGEDSFSNCISLESITLPDSTESIGKLAFSACQALTHIDLPDALIKIDDHAFAYCENLIEISIPAGISKLNNNVFGHCSNLKRVFLPDTLETLGEFSLSFCWGMKVIHLPDSITRIEQCAFTHCHRLTAVVIPDNVVTLGNSAFSNCNGLAVVYLPESLKTISKDAFSQCSALESVIIPAGVTDIGANAFNRCPKLTIYGVAGSYAESYAKDNNLKFIAGSPLDTSASWARDGITDAIGKGFVRGAVQRDYSTVITRTEFCRMAIDWVEYATGKDIDAILAERGLTRDKDAFTDTSDPDILAAYALGITNGTGDNKFSPNSEFSREQAAAMIANTCKVIGAIADGLPESGFADLEKAAEWAVAGINFVRANGIMQGTGDDNFSPKTTFTREQSIITFNNIDYLALAG